MIPYDSILLFVTFAFLAYTSKKGIKILFSLLSALSLIVSIGILNIDCISTISLNNNDFHNNLITFLSDNVGDTQIDRFEIKIDNIDAEIYDKLNEIPQVREVIPHHSWGIKSTGETVFDEPLNTLYKILSIRIITDSIALTQTKTLKEMVDTGVREFDIRVSQDKNGEWVVNHGVIFGTLDEFISELKTAIQSKIDNFVIHTRISFYNPNNNQYRELRDAMNQKLLDEQMDNVRIYPLNNVIFIETADESKLFGLFKKSLNEFGLYGAFLTPSAKTISLHFVWITVVVVLLGGVLYTFFQKIKESKK